MEYRKGQVLDLTISATAGIQRWGTARVEATIKAVTEKAILVSAQAKIGASEFCFRCKRRIDNPVSRLVGYGPECSEQLNIPRDATPEQARRIIADMPGQLRETWVPLSVIQKVETLKDVEPEKEVAELYVKGTRIAAKTPFRFKELLNKIAGAKWDGTERAWTYPVSPRIAVALYEAVKEIPVTMSAEFKALGRQAREEVAAAAIKTVDIATLTGPKLTRFEPWEHQNRAYNYAFPLMGAMLPMDMGTGKTKVTIDLIINRGHKRVLIACPRAVIEVWEDEITKHSPDGVEIAYLALNQDNKSVKQKAAMIKEFLALCAVRGVTAVVGVNYDIVWREPMNDELLKAGFDLLVTDECHKVKAPGGKASMFLSKLVERTPKEAVMGSHTMRRVGLTGTPLPHSPLDAYAQYRIIDKGVYGTSFQQFKQTYALLDQWGGFVRPINEKDFNEKFYSIAYRVEAKDVLSLPEAQYLSWPVTLSPKAMKVYKQMEKTFIAEVEGGEITASNALSKMLRLQQITSGFLPIEDSNDVAKIDDGKQEVLTEIMDSIGPKEPLVVFARFTYDLDQIKEAVEKSGRTYAELSGRKNQLRDWKAGDYDVIGVQIQSGGAGVDLTRSRYSVYYSLGYSLGDYMQSRARINRPGQTRPTFSYHILARGTVDEKIFNALESREDMIEAILKEIKGAVRA